MAKKKTTDSLSRYRVTLEFDAESEAWVVRYPELPGCLAHGATPAEAMAEGELAAELWIECAKEIGVETP